MVILTLAGGANLAVIGHAKRIETLVVALRAFAGIYYEQTNTNIQITYLIVVGVLLVAITFTLEDLLVWNNLLIDFIIIFHYIPSIIRYIISISGNQVCHDWMYHVLFTSILAKQIYLLLYVLKQAFYLYLAEEILT